MNNLSIVQTVAVYIIPLIFAITLHEAAHAFVAHKYGDNTAKLLGRLSLNPMHHIDPFGTVVFPLISIVLGAMSGGAGFIFGWAKPVPINFSKLKSPKKDLLWIALAGPLSNLAMALIWGLLLKGTLYLDNYFGVPLSLMAQAGISINVSLLILNLLPILPLDGGRILFSLLPVKQAQQYAQTERYGMWILIALLLLGGLNYIMQPLYSLLVGGIFTLLR
ncbi:MAG: site-2 protease family protein [Neisseriales bacterium]|jgi:Zn-dependent protease|nr:MAG: site-2 protease family protein [Neisseriales bacterium]HRG61869.1 site-2 protease family protein [Burkholderiales bacterium]